jgi:penicillin-binding protein 1A
MIFIQNTARFILYIILGLLGVIGLFILTVYLEAFGHLQSKSELKTYENAAASVVLSEEGRLIGKFFSENRTNIDFNQIPPHLIDALIATEDARFYSHNGIDIRSLLRVIVKSVLLNDKSAGGGSTISQQLAKNIFGRKDFGIMTLPINKTKEAIMAYRLENTFSKDEILTLYLNTVSFGENVYGIEAASTRFFSKKVEDLKIEEAALLVGMLKANTSYNPRLYPENAKNRRNVVISQMERYNYIDAHIEDSLMQLPLEVKYSNIESESPAGYFLAQVRNEAEHILQHFNSDSVVFWNLEEDGLIINTTLNLDLQNYATQSFNEHLSVMQKRLNDQYTGAAGKRFLDQIAERELLRLNLTHRADEVRVRRMFNWDGSYSDSISVIDSIRSALTLLHAGLLAIDPETGAVKTWVGGVDFASQPFDQVLARRQLASTFKPILYAAALEQGIGPCQYYDNDSIILAGFDDWSPVNYDLTYGGKYSLTGALAKSMNVPTFNLFLDIRLNELDNLWKKMGFSFNLKHSPSLALGTAEANLREVAVAYSVFANGGYKVNPFTITSIQTSTGEIIYTNDLVAADERVLSERSSMLMTAMLQKAIDEGTGIGMRYNYGVSLPLAGKTGTSQNYADAWFAAYNPKLVIASRVGASSQLIHFRHGRNGSGSALALPLVGLTLQKAQQNPELRSQLSASFPELPYELLSQLDCPDYKEKNIFENFIDLFRSDIVTFEEAKSAEVKSEEAMSEEAKSEEGGKKRSLLRRIFRRN